LDVASVKKFAGKFAGKTEAEPLPENQLAEMKEMTNLGGSLYHYKEKSYTFGRSILQKTTRAIIFEICFN
jgi:hypothetical protein